jgi:phosphomannomutase
MLQESGASRLSVAVGRDARTSSPSLTRELVRGLQESGISVCELGLVSTPTFYHSVAADGYDGGVQVSASHNPKEWNGFKLVRAGAVPISRDSGINALKEIVETESFSHSGTQPSDVHCTIDPTEKACDEQLALAEVDLSNIRPLKVCVDTANGMGAPDLEALFVRVPSVEVVWLNKELDGTFPAHPADPMLPENNVRLQKTIPQEKCDFGIAADGDGDRYFFFDETGAMVPQEIVRGIMAQIELASHSGATVVYDVRPGRITRDMVEDAGGRGVLAPVGHSLIKEKMLAEDAVFGGESSGHFFYKTPHGTYEAPFILVAKFLHLVGSQPLSLSEHVAPLKKYWNSGEINMKLENREAGLAKLEAIKVKYADGTLSEIDGTAIEYPDFWFLVRLANTEPLMRFTLEARDKETMEARREEILALIRS